MERINAVILCLVLLLLIVTAVNTTIIYLQVTGARITGRTVGSGSLNEEGWTCYVAFTEPGTIYFDRCEPSAVP